MKALRLLLAGSVCALSFLTAKADKQFIDLTQKEVPTFVIGKKV
jgi:hypothetical protein